GVPPYPGQVAAERPMTVDDVVTKAAASIGVALVAGVLAAVWAHGQIAAQAASSVFTVWIVSMLVGFGLAMFLSFRPKPSAGLTLAYSAVEGVFLGTVTAVLETLLPPSVSGLGLQAVMGTALVFVVMLFVYRTGAVNVTPKLTKRVSDAALLMLVNLVFSLFGANLGLRGPGTLSIILGIVFIGIAAFMLLLDFDMADNMIRSGMPAKWAWYAAFGLMATLVWLYFEILH